MKVTYKDHMGSDLTVVNSARVSFGKHSDELTEKDKKLIKYLAKHNHWTPFGHPQLTVHVEAPIFVARQLAKHQVGLVWNEVSRRYVDDAPKYFVPDFGWRLKADNVKQGSSDTISPDNERIKAIYSGFIEHADALYDILLNTYKIAPEQARMVLPQSTYTEWYWTGSLAAFFRVCNLRLDPSTQLETSEIAAQLYRILGEKFPVSTAAMMEAALDSYE